MPAASGAMVCIAARGAGPAVWLAALERPIERPMERP
jgi:hypothetical protein